MDVKHTPNTHQTHTKCGAEFGNIKRKVILEERCGICKAKGHRRNAGLCSEGLLIGVARMGDGALAVQAEGDRVVILSFASKSDI